MRVKSSRFPDPWRCAVVCLLTVAVSSTVGAGPWEEGAIACYAVPALSSIQRLPDVLPPDARISSELRVVAAQGEYESVSFVVAPRADVERFELRASSLAGPGDRIAASDVDIKVVKCWYQAGTAWYSYFADSNRRELVPELLLNDETLVRVEREKRENYLRVGGEYRWISYPRDQAVEAFNYLTEPVADSETLLPVALNRGENKQFWITVRVREGLASGIYRGSIELVGDGKPLGAMALAVRVLPFTLPAPKAYHDVNSDFLVTIYGTGILDMCNRLEIPEAEADRMQVAIYENLLAHNVRNCRSDLRLAYQRDRAEAIAQLRRELRLMEEAGFVMKPLLSRGWAYPANEKSMDEYRARIDDLVDTLVSEVGHREIYITSWDEAGVARIKTMRERAEYTADKGVGMWVTTRKGHHFDLAGYCIDYANHGGWPSREHALKWHALGAKVASYAGPHTGPENPDVFRRWEGMARYKAHYDGSFNYKYFSQLHSTLYKKHKANVWNDFSGGSFRGFNMVYPTVGGPIDTLAWEGFREGIDDVRYATLLKLEADKAIATGRRKPVFAARKALMWLELLDAESADLNAVRLEMIEYILKIRRALEV